MNFRCIHNEQKRKTKLMIYVNKKKQTRKSNKNWFLFNKPEKIFAAIFSCRKFSEISGFLFFSQKFRDFQENSENFYQEVQKFLLKIAGNMFLGS